LFDDDRRACRFALADGSKTRYRFAGGKRSIPDRDHRKAKPMKLTPNQVDAMLSLNQYEGQTVEVLTSGYTANVAPEAVRSAVATVSSAALRGLEAKGLVKIVDAYWKGARVTVVKAYDFVAESRAAREAAPAPVLLRAAMTKPVVVRMARYEAAYMALHGRTVSVTWTGDKVRVLEHGGDSAYALHFDADDLDEVSERMEEKVREKAARIEAAANAPDDIFEALGLPKSASEGESR